MEGTNIYYPDDYPSHDHTYFGNGCSNGWGGDGTTGSKVACGTRLSPTKDGENQINGTYYNHSSATLTAVLSNIPDNYITPDSFCPLGWQLPYSGTGGDYYNKSRSWKYIFEQYGYTTGGIYGIMSYPLSYIYSGYYHWDLGRLYSLNIEYLSWSNTMKDYTSAYRINTWDDQADNFYYRVGGRMGGATLRCDCKVSILNSFPWHPRKTLNILGFIKLLDEPEIE